MASRRSMLRLAAAAAAIVVVAALFVHLIVTSPASARLPVVPAESPVRDLPRIPVYRALVALGDIFKAISEALTPPEPAVRDIISGAAKANVLYCLIELGVFDALASKEPQPCIDVLGDLTEEGSEVVCRLSRAGASFGLLQEGPPGKFALTDAGKVLASDHPNSLRPEARFMLDFRWMAGSRAIAYHDNLASKTVSGFKRAHGSDFFDYVKTAPDLETTFDNALSSFSISQNAAIVADYQIDEDATICDVGGGSGGLLATFLAHYPDVYGMLIDQPTQVHNAEIGALAPYANRSMGVAANFFEPLPAVLQECTHFVAKQVSHDWNDKDVARILTNIRNVAQKGAKIVLFDAVLGVDGIIFERAKYMMDFFMLALPLGARERTFEEFAHVFDDCCRDDLAAPIKLIKMRSELSAIEARLVA